MSLSKTEFGPFTLYTIETGRFRLDGGAMFGVVPKTLWSKYIPADELNRIPMAMRCLLVHSSRTGRLYLIDNGIGNKFDEKFQKIYSIDFEHSSLENSLSYHGFSTDDITDIVFTHLHFDHCGGTTAINSSGESEIIFKDANLWVTKSHWETATEPNAREKASFLKENIEPLKNTNRLHLVDGEYTYEDGFSTLIVNGHTIGQQLPKLEVNGKTLIFAADLLPTAVHVPLPWVMGYDMYPAQTLQEKEDFLKTCVDNNWLIYLEHDADHEVITIKKDGKRFGIGKELTLDEM